MDDQPQIRGVSSSAKSRREYSITSQVESDVSGLFGKLCNVSRLVVAFNNASKFLYNYTINLLFISDINNIDK